ncbi:hypothetical protein QTP86_031629 [Hemibagrus guttatus]|nr:hypothetical protein QTP86_031629 [Hemibagrus guttatus]
MSQDLWLQNYDATCRLAQEIAENIQERSRQQRTGGNPAKLNMTLRASLQKLKQNITQLRETLARASSQRRMCFGGVALERALKRRGCGHMWVLGSQGYFSVTSDSSMQSEADRRQNLVDDLVTREKQLFSSFSRDPSAPEPSRSALLTGGFGAEPAQNPWLVNESEETRGLTFREIKEQQQHIIEEIIDDITQLVDTTDSRIRNETRRVQLVETKSASCGMLVVIVLLLIAIVVVAAWPT